MTLRIRSILVTVLASIVLIAILYFSMRPTILGGYQSLDDRLAQTTAQEAGKIFRAEVDKLATLTTEFTTRADTAAFLGGQMPDYAAKNLGFDSLRNLGIDLAIVYDSQGQLVFGLFYDLNSGSYTPVPTSIQTNISSSDLNLHADIASSYRGLLSIPEEQVQGAANVIPAGCMMVASRPILSPEDADQVIGTYILGRLITKTEVSRLSGILDHPVSLVRWAEPSSEYEIIRPRLTADGAVNVIVKDERFLIAYTRLDEIKDLPAMIMKVEMSRDAYAFGLGVVNSLAVVLIVAAAVVNILMFMVLNQMLLQPFARLGRTLQYIRSRGDYSVRFPVAGNDELGKLTAVSNEFVADYDLRLKEVEQLKGAQRKQVQLNAVAQLANLITTLQDRSKIIEVAVEQITNRFNLYFVGVFLLDETKLFLVLHGSTGSIVPPGYRLTVGGSSTIGQAVVTGKRHAMEIGVRKERPSFTRLPLARSELAVPIVAGDQIIGAMGFQSTQANAFQDEADLGVFDELANSLGLALVNAEAFRNLRLRQEELEHSYHRYIYQQWGEENRVRRDLHYTYEAEEARKDSAELQVTTLPLVLYGQPIGQVTLETDRQTWQAEEKAFAETILEQAALALENTRLLEASQRRAAHERLVADISRKVRSSASLNTILSSTILELGRALNASYAQIHIQPEAEAVADSAEPPDQPARVDTGDL